MADKVFGSALLILGLSSVLIGAQPRLLDASTSTGTESDDRTPLIVIPRLTAHVGVSANLDQPPWVTAAQLTGFLEVEGEALARHPTQVRLAYDREALLVGFRCEGQAGDDLKRDVTERDGWPGKTVRVRCVTTPDAAPEDLSPRMEP